MKLSIVIPVYNEKATLAEIVKRVQAIPYNKELIIVDDASRDGSRDILRELAQEYENIRTFFHDRNQGKGAALRTGFSQVKGDVVLIQDADLEYNPIDYPELLKPIQRGVADVVYGSRLIGGAPHRVLFFWHYVGNKMVTTLSNMFTNLNLTDMETCYKVFKAEVVKNLKIKSDRFGVEPELTAKIARQRCRIYEVPISYKPREQKKLSPLRDGWPAVQAIWRYRNWQG